MKLQHSKRKVIFARNLDDMWTIIMCIKQNGGQIAGSAEEYMCKFSRGVFQQLNRTIQVHLTIST